MVRLDVGSIVLSLTGSALHRSAARFISSAISLGNGNEIGNRNGNEKESGNENGNEIESETETKKETETELPKIPLVQERLSPHFLEKWQRLVVLMRMRMRMEM